MRTCNECGTRASETALRCPKCGGSLPRPESPARPRGLEQAPPGAAGLHEAWLWQPSQIGKRQPRVGTGRAEARHFLVPALGSVLPLDSKSGVVLVLGRDEGCEVRIRSQTVSRRHAQIRFEGSPARAYLRDLGTVNGTRVNGALVEGEHPLVDGDRIRVGDVNATYRILGAGVSSATLDAPPDRTLLDATIPIAAAAEKARPLPGDLAGDIALFPMSDLLDRLKKLQVNGTFVVEVDGLEGIACFTQGDVVTSVLGELEGERAYQGIASLRSGRFRFVPQARKISAKVKKHERLNRTPPHGAPT